MTAMDSAEADTTRFARQLDIIRSRNPALAAAIEQAGDDGTEVVAARDGALTIRVPTADGKPIFLHSQYAPLKEAERLVDQHPTEGLVSYVVYGFGMGHHVSELYRRASSESIIIVFENNPAVLRQALLHGDFSELLAQPRFFLFGDAPKAEVIEQLQPYIASLMMGFRYVGHPPSLQAQPDYYRRVQQVMSDFADFGKTSLMTLMGNNYTTMLNIVMNLPYYLFTPPLTLLKDRFKGFPGIVISAGPSLARNRHLLPQAKGKAVLVSVATMLKPLLAEGVEPDYVTILDYHEISRRFLEGIDDLGDVHLVAEPKVTWHALDVYPGLMSVLQSSFADNCLRDRAPKHEGLQAGATVAHLAFYLAEYMGCDPIILVGQDLGYGDGVYYTPGTAIHDIWAGELNRFQTIEMKEWERIVRRKNHLRTVEDIHGRPMYTDDQMHTYLQQFVRDIHNTSRTVIDATEGGARKEGATVMPLAEALEQFATAAIPENRLAYKQEVRWWDASARTGARDELSNRIDESERMKELCDETVRVLQDMLDHVEDQPRVNSLMQRIDTIRDEVAERRQDHHALVAGLGQIDELVKLRHDKEIAALGLEGIDKQRRQLERDIAYIGGMSRTCDSLVDMLRQGIDRLTDFQLPGEGLRLKASGLSKERIADG